MNSSHQKFKNIYLIVLTIVTVICIVIGIFSHLYHWFSFSSDSKDSNAENISENQNADVSEFSAIDLSLHIGDVRIVYGSDYSVEYSQYPTNIVPTWSVENDVLVVKQKGGNVKWNDFKNVDCILIITIPQETKLNSISCDIEMGNLEINDMIADSVEISADMGNIDLSHVDFTTLDVEASMGSINAKNCNIDTSSYEADMGSIEINGNFQSITASCDMGSIEIDCDHINDVKLDLECDLGSIELNGKSYGSKYKN